MGDSTAERMQLLRRAFEQPPDFPWIPVYVDGGEHVKFELVTAAVLGLYCPAAPGEPTLSYGKFDENCPITENAFRARILKCFPSVGAQSDMAMYGHRLTGVGADILSYATDQERAQAFMQAAAERFAGTGLPVVLAALMHLAQGEGTERICFLSPSGLPIYEGWQVFKRRVAADT